MIPTIRWGGIAGLDALFACALALGCTGSSSGAWLVLGPRWTASWGIRRRLFWRHDSYSRGGVRWTDGRGVVVVTLEQEEEESNQPVDQLTRLSRVWKVPTLTLNNLTLRPANSLHWPTIYNTTWELRRLVEVFNFGSDFIVTVKFLSMRKLEVSFKPSCHQYTRPMAIFYCSLYSDKPRFGEVLPSIKCSDNSSSSKASGYL